MRENLFLIILIAIIGGLYLMMKTVGSLYDRVIQKLAGLIQEQEGYYEGSRSYRNNNPGNLVFANQLGNIGKDEKGFTIFPDYQTGYDALIRQLNAAFYGGSIFYNIHMTLYEFFALWDRTNPVAYAENIAAEFGVSADTKLEDLKV